MRSGIAGPRILLRKLREVMAEPVEPQERLDKITVLIASNMVAEVCSVYVLRADGVLELFSTQGLARGAVHKAGLRVGEGLVGIIAAEARPLNLARAQEHPAFAYLPETKEDAYKSFHGVPILRAGRTLGVLVVQNKSEITYTEEEIEALQTTAMVIAEMIATGDFETLTQVGGALDHSRAMHAKGIALSAGIGLGHVVLHDPRVVVADLISDDPEKEARRLEQAIDDMRISIDSLLERGAEAGGGEHSQILEAYRMFAHDRGWVRRMHEAIDQGLSAEAAVERTQSDTRARMLRSTDPYLRERLHDFDDLANRLLRQLIYGGPDGHHDLPENAILVARNLGAAELLDYDKDKLRGLILEEGAATSHATIVARALGVPTVGQIPGAASFADTDDAVIVDGDTGEVFIRPASDVEDAYAEKVRFQARRQAQYRELKDLPARTLDGVDINIQMNAGLLVDLPQLEESGADGIGLFRTELQFMIAASMPRIGEQRTHYQAVLDAAAALDKTVTFRSLDVGGDKVLPYFQPQPEENPAMGWRAIRLSLDRPGLFRPQIRALLQASANRELRIMFPMVTDISEFDAASALVAKELTHLRRHGHEIPEVIKVGAMIEVPSILYQLDELMERADFVSVGSNDLHQFFFAADRGNTMVTNRFHVLSLPFMRALKAISETAKKHETPVTLCGELAGEPVGALALLGLGFRSISMSPASIGAVKAAIRSVNLEELTATVDMALKDHEKIKELPEILSTFAAKGVVD